MANIAMSVLKSEKIWLPTAPHTESKYTSVEKAGIRRPYL